MARQTVLVQLPGGGAVELSLDRESEVALHVQLFEQIKHFIGTNRLPQGHELPSVRTLARHLGVSTVTVGRAIEALRDRGLVETVAGKGVYVVDFARASDGRTGEERLQDFAALVVSQALTVGLDPALVAAAINGLIRSGRRRRDPRRIVVIDEFDSVDVEVDSLRRSLAGEGIDVAGIKLGEIEANAELIDRAGTIIAAPHCYGLVRQRLEHRIGDIVGLTLNLDPEVAADLRALPPDTRVLLVATVPAFIGWMSYAVSSLSLLDQTPEAVSMTNRRALAGSLSGADVVVYGSGCRRDLPGLIPDGVRGVELRHVVDGDSLESLRSRLKALLLAEEDGEPA
ncbi:GntR family transcriptional regulator [Plantactinospora sp. KBS50]|uniref:GntR family transcriptional regulator n=1 Tax=Plantactinospora sp. KBS50 TaxID=2024580 RepID=UPI0012FD557F|nr:GntR family transcriptional regulator [Plantactinospora sp. KBS50]